MSGDEAPVVGSEASGAVLKLVGRQKAEFDHAAALRSWMLRAQVAIAITTSAAIFVHDERLLYLAALAGLALACLWLFLWRKLATSFAHAERLRRATMICGGLGVALDGDELFELATEGAATDADADRRVDPDYFATKLPPGVERLSAMAMESAIWSKTLAGYAARETWGLFGAVALVAVVFLFGSAGVVVQMRAWELLARVVLTVLVALLSTDFLGAALAYDRASRDLGQIVGRLRPHPGSVQRLERLMVIIGDYNAIVGSMPVFPRGLYKRYETTLNHNFKMYLTGPK